MVILCHHYSEMDMCAEFLRMRKLPHQLRRSSSSVFDPAHDSIKVMTLPDCRKTAIPESEPSICARTYSRVGAEAFIPKSVFAQGTDLIISFRQYIDT